MSAEAIDWSEIFSQVEPVLDVIHHQVRIGIIVSATFLAALFIAIFGIMKKHDQLHYRAVFLTVLPLIFLVGLLLFNIIPSLRPPLMIEGTIMRSDSENPFALSSRVLVEVEKAYSFSADGLGRHESRFEGTQNFPAYENIIDYITPGKKMLLLVTVDLEIFGYIHDNGTALSVVP